MPCLPAGRRPRAVLFDLDGTLLNCERAHARLRKTLCEMMGLDAEKMRSGGRVISELFREQGLGEKEYRLYVRLWRLGEAQVRPRLFWDANLTFEMLAARGVMTAIGTNRPANAYLVKLLRAADLNVRRLSFVLAQDKRPLLARFKLFMAEGIMLPCPVVPSRHPKPDPRFIEPVRHKLERLPGYPRSVLFVGDTLVDLEFAKKNGFAFAATLHGDLKDRAVWEAHGADLILPRLRDLLKHIE